ncbi:MAG: ParA family protein [Cyclobacteriaceae bacterium]|nr:ParA family protein [Cyclobacteriaceae bacterium]
MAKVISVSNHKGGVGKTTAVANLGFALARQFKVLMIDLDPQANLSSGLGFENSPITMATIMKDRIHFQRRDIEPEVITKYVHIIPSSIMLNEIEVLLHDKPDGLSVLKDILYELKNKYDIIFIDCPPALNYLTLNALNTSNLIVIPAKPERFSVKGVNQISSIADKNNIPFKILFNQVNKRSLFHKRIMKLTRENYNGSTLSHYVRNNVSLAEAFDEAKNIFHYKSESTGAQDFVEIADELSFYI